MCSTSTLTTATATGKLRIESDSGRQRRRCPERYFTRLRRQKSWELGFSKSLIQKKLSLLRRRGGWCGVAAAAAMMSAAPLHVGVSYVAFAPSNFCVMKYGTTLCAKKEANEQFLALASHKKGSHFCSKFTLCEVYIYSSSSKFVLADKSLSRLDCCCCCCTHDAIANFAKLSQNNSCGFFG